MYVLVGGLNSFWGPSVGVLILLIIPEFFFRDLKGDLPYVTAAILLIIAFLLPDGIVGLVKLVKDADHRAGCARREVSGRCFSRLGD